MRRRSFLNAVLGLTASAIFIDDPEKLLWTPGKLISIPKSSECTDLGWIKDVSFSPLVKPTGSIEMKHYQKLILSYIVKGGVDQNGLRYVGEEVLHEQEIFLECGSNRYFFGDVVGPGEDPMATRRQVNIDTERKGIGISYIRPQRPNRHGNGFGVDHDHNLRH